MLGIQIRLHLFQVQHRIAVNAIGHGEEPVDVVPHYRIFRRGGVHQAHAGDFLFHLFHDGRGEILGLQFL